MSKYLHHIRVINRILTLGDFNLPKVEWRVQEDGSTLLPMGITTDLENDLIEGMLCYDLGQVNSTPIQNGTFLDLIFSSASTYITVEICESHLLVLDRQLLTYALTFFMMLYGLVLKNLCREPQIRRQKWLKR
jgi:hypothetical protein